MQQLQLGGEAEEGEEIGRGRPRAGAPTPRGGGPGGGGGRIGSRGQIKVEG